MKRVYVGLLLFYLVLHFVFPLIYYSIYGFFTIYSDQEYNLSVLKGVALNFIAVGGAIFCIRFLPERRKLIQPRFNHGFSFLMIAAVILVVGIIQAGGYEGILEGKQHGALTSYLSLIFDSTTALVLFVLFQKKINYPIVILLGYILLMTLTGSRSAIILVVLIGLMGPAFQNGLEIKKKIWRFASFIGILSPFLFYYATSVRQEVDTALLYQLIIGRISMVESSAIPIEGKDKKLMDTELFSRKYGFVNQIKQSANEISPIDPFEHDINPNQYYRAIFKGAREENAGLSYMSMNMTLPVYLYMKTNFFFASVLSIAFLTLLYYCWIRNSNNIYILILVMLNIYYILQYFDWVMLTAGFFRTYLTILTLKLFEKFTTIGIAAIKKGFMIAPDAKL